MTLKMHTTADKAAQVIALLQLEMRQCDVARQLNLSRFSVRRVFQRFQETGDYIRRRGSIWQTALHIRKRLPFHCVDKFTQSVLQCC